MSKFSVIELKSGEEIKLTERELLFCEHYLSDTNRNATQSAIKAGFSEKSARTYAAQTLAKSNIQAYIKDRTAPILEALGVTVEKTMREWAELAFSRPGQEISKDSAIPMGYQDSTNFKTVKMGETEVDQVEKTVSFNYGPKMKALTVISEHLGIINKKPEPPAPVQNITFSQLNNYLKEK